MELELDPRMPGMQTITNLLVKKVGGYILPGLKNEACKATKSPEKWALSAPIKASQAYYSELWCRKFNYLHEANGWERNHALLPILGVAFHDIRKSNIVFLPFARTGRRE